LPALFAGIYETVLAIIVMETSKKGSAVVNLLIPFLYVYRDVTQILHLLAMMCRSIFEAQRELGVSQALRFMHLMFVSD